MLCLVKVKLLIDGLICSSRTERWMAVACHDQDLIDGGLEMVILDR